MKITWITRSFLDYRIPLYESLNQLCGDNLTVIYFKDVVPERCQKKLEMILGERAIGLSGEIRFGGKKKENQTFANKGGIRIPIRPGLYKVLKKTKPDIVLSDGFFQWTYAALLLNAFRKTPHMMCYERTSFTERNVTFIRKSARKIASKFITGICCNGIQTKTYLEEFGFPSNKLFLGNMAADTKGLQRALSRVKKDELKKLKVDYDINNFVFLFVGQLIPRKGIMELLDSWKQFIEDKLDITLLLLGDGALMEDAKNYVSKNQLESVKLLGSVDYSKVAKFYALSDVFLISTLEDNWSLVVPEAMSCSLPIVSSKYNGCWPELVKNENGWVFDPLDKNDFVNTLNKVIAKKEDLEVMGNASSKIVKEFSPEIIANKIFNSCKGLT